MHTCDAFMNVCAMETVTKEKERDRLTDTNWVKGERKENEDKKKSIKNQKPEYNEPPGAPNRTT